MSKIYIIRHGQTDLNKNHVLQGRVDEPLNEDGLRQAKFAAALLRTLDVSIDQVWSSPLQRAKDTAEIIADEGVPIQTDDRLLEMDYGPYEGMDLTSPPPEIMAFFGDFVNQPAPEGMESLPYVTQRLGAIAAFILTENMANPMILTDRWTLMMVVILAVQTGVAVLVGKKDNDEETLENA